MIRRTRPPSASLLPALRSHAWFASCPQSLQEALIELGGLWQLRPGEALFERGQDERGLCCVLAGALKIGTVHPQDGSQRLMLYLEPYQWVGEVALIDGLPRSQDAVADVDTTVLLVPRTALENWLDAHPRCWRDLARLACSKVRLVTMAIEDNASLSTEAQLARRLVFAATGYGQSIPPTLRRRLRLSQESLAHMLGISRQTINKTLKSLARQGLIEVRYAEIEILDAPALLALAGPVAPALRAGLPLVDSSPAPAPSSAPAPAPASGATPRS